MLNSAILDVAMGLALIFLLLSLLVSATCEMLAGFFKWRAANLWDGLEQLLQSADARDALYNHPLIRGLAPNPASTGGAGAAGTSGAQKAGRWHRIVQWFRPADSETGMWAGTMKRVVGALWLSHDANVAHLPSYIPQRSFALALIDVIRAPHALDNKLRDGLDSLIDTATFDPIGFAQSLAAKLEALGATPGVDASARQRVADLRARLCAAPDAARVAALKGSVQQAIAAVPPANQEAVSAVREWLNAPRASNWPELRASLAVATDQVATPGVRAALDGILNGLSVGRNDQTVRELQAFIQRSEDVRQGLNNANEKLKLLAGALTPLLDEAAGDIERFRRNVEIWFNDGMDRVSGSYKRHTTGWQAAIGFALAVTLNVDALLIVRTLYRDPALRQSLASQAQSYANAPSPTVERRGVEFASTAASLGVKLSSSELQHGDTLTATVTLPASGGNGVLQIDGQSANLTFGCGVTDTFRLSTVCPTHGQRTVPVLARVNDVNTESLESFTVSLRRGDTAAAVESVPVNVVARPTGATRFDSLRAQIDTLGLPIGWRSCQDKSDLQVEPLWCGGTAWMSWSTVLGLSSMLLGWLVTTAAMSLGAPFWFDTLKRFVSIRTAGKAPEESPLKPKEQPKPLAPGEPEIKDMRGV